MAREDHEFRLSKKEFEYLKQLLSHDNSLAGLLRFHEPPSGPVTLQLDRSEATQLRDRLMTQMEVYGFDKDYYPNEHGQILEPLIDKLFLR